MRLALLASAALITLGGTAWAQDADHSMSNRESMKASRQAGADSDRRNGGAARDERAEGRRDRDGADRDVTRHGDRADRDDRGRDHVGIRDDADHERRGRSVEIDRDHVRDRTVRERDGDTYREGARHETTVRKRVSINPERRTRYRDAFVKTYRERPAEDFDVRVGARVPDRVVVDRVPDTYYEEEPDLRGLNYFVDRGHAYLVDPDSREVIDDLD